MDPFSVRIILLVPSTLTVIWQTKSIGSRSDLSYCCSENYTRMDYCLEAVAQPGGPGTPSPGRRKKRKRKRKERKQEKRKDKKKKEKVRHKEREAVRMGALHAVLKLVLAI